MGIYNWCVLTENSLYFPSNFLFIQFISLVSVISLSLPTLKPERLKPLFASHTDDLLVYTIYSNLIYNTKTSCFHHCFSSIKFLNFHYYSKMSYDHITPLPKNYFIFISLYIFLLCFTLFKWHIQTKNTTFPSFLFLCWVLNIYLLAPLPAVAPNLVTV